MGDLSRWAAAIDGRCEVCDSGEGVHQHHCRDRASDVDRRHLHVLCWYCALMLRKMPDGTVVTFQRCADGLTEAERVLLALQRGAGVADA